MRTIFLGLVFLVACGSSHTNPDGHVSGDGTSDGASGAVCGGLAHVACGATEYCDYADNGCGIGDKTGICKPRPQTCPLIAGHPICACDGNVYVGECPTYMNGVDLDAHGTCAVPKGSFACGYTQCDLLTQYCLREPQAAAADRYSCVALPAACASPTCACLANERCGNACTGSATVGLTLTCP